MKRTNKKRPYWTHGLTAEQRTKVAKLARELRASRAERQGTWRVSEYNDVIRSHLRQYANGLTNPSRWEQPG